MSDRLDRFLDNEDERARLGLDDRDLRLLRAIRRLIDSRTARLERLIRASATDRDALEEALGSLTEADTAIDAIAPDQGDVP